MAVPSVKGERASPLFWYLMSSWFLMIDDDLCPRKLLGQVWISKGQVFETSCQFCWEENGDRISWGAKIQKCHIDFPFWVENSEWLTFVCFMFSLCDSWLPQASLVPMGFQMPSKSSQRMLPMTGATFPRLSGTVNWHSNGKWKLWRMYFLLNNGGIPASYVSLSGG